MPSKKKSGSKKSRTVKKSATKSPKRSSKGSKSPATRARSAYIQTYESGRIVVRNRTTKESMSLKKYVQKGQPWGALDKLR